MKDVGNVTRVAPDRRVESLMKFRKRITDNTDVIIYSQTVLFWANNLYHLDSTGSEQLGTQFFYGFGSCSWPEYQ